MLEEIKAKLKTNESFKAMQKNGTEFCLLNNFQLDDVHDKQLLLADLNKLSKNNVCSVQINQSEITDEAVNNYQTNPQEITLIIKPEHLNNAMTDLFSKLYHDELNGIQELLLFNTTAVAFMSNKYKEYIKAQVNAGCRKILISIPNEAEIKLDERIIQNMA